MVDLLTAVDDLAAGADGDVLRAWVTSGTELGAERVRCPVSEDDHAACQRLDLALRMLHAQEPSQWCRAVDATTVVVRRWPLPARGLVVYDADGSEPGVFVLAVGRAGGRGDAWRFRFDGPTTSVLERGRELLPT